MPEDTRTIQLPSDLCERAEQKFASRFETVEQLLNFILQELVRDDAAQMDQSDQRILEQRLSDLGYNG